MRKPIVAGNWKMNKTLSEAIDLVDKIKNGSKEVDNVDIIVSPPFVSIKSVVDGLKGSNVQVAAQNCHWEESGAYTGEISVSMIKSTGAEFVIVGHSERRKYFSETDEVVNKKAKLVLASGMTPIICIGETLEERESDKTFEVVERQVKGAFSGMEEEKAEQVILAYEPVWAIGTGKTATPDQAQEVHSKIRALIEELYSGDIAQSKRILYGGSMKPDNCEELMKEPDIDGGLIGGASLKHDSFTDIIRKTSLLYS